MNKEELIEKMSEISNLAKKDCSKALDAIIEVVMNTLQSKEEVRLVGFGTFYSLERKASDGINPKTREKIKIPASNRPKFRAGKQFIDAVN
jgi:DNA-binding protein HU-beta